MSIAARLTAIREQIEQAARRVGRHPDEITLVAVSKTFSAEAVREAWSAGQTDFGENKVQEALSKMDGIEQGPQWHLIGHLQRNKVNAVVGRFSLIHSVDSVRLIEALEKRAQGLKVRQSILLQINVAGEASKSGAAPEELPQLIEALGSAQHLECLGLMTIPPVSDLPEDARQWFRALRELWSTLPTTSNIRPIHLSMGMSDDFEIAIEEGSTLVRIGTAIFGDRSQGMV